MKTASRESDDLAARAALFWWFGRAFVRGSDWDVLFGTSYAAVNRSVIKAEPTIWT